MKAKPGELKAGWSKREQDIMFAWGGNGAVSQDGSLLYGTFCMKRPQPNFPEQGYTFIESFADELKNRGYDLTTLRFSIQKNRT